MTEQAIRNYKLKITAAWQKAVESIIETGQLLQKANDGLEHGQWGKLFEGDNKLPFGQETARRLMKIAEHPVLSNPSFRRNLPPSWRTLWELISRDDILPPQQLERHLADGTINAETTQAQAIALVRQADDQEPESDFERLMKEINRWLTLVPPSENDLERYHREHLFHPPGFLTGKFARLKALGSELEQMSHRMELKARNAAVATDGVRTVAEAIEHEDGNIVVDDGSSLLLEDA